MPASQLTTPKTYAALRHRVQDILSGGPQRIEQVKLRTFWETGRLINQHLAHRQRADYGAQV